MGRCSATFSHPVASYSREECRLSSVVDRPHGIQVIAQPLRAGSSPSSQARTAQVSRQTLTAARGLDPRADERPSPSSRTDRSASEGPTRDRQTDAHGHLPKQGSNTCLLPEENGGGDSNFRHANQTHNAFRDRRKMALLSQKLTARATTRASPPRIKAEDSQPAGPGAVAGPGWSSGGGGARGPAP